MARRTACALATLLLPLGLAALALAAWAAAHGPGRLIHGGSSRYTGVRIQPVAAPPGRHRFEVRLAGPGLGRGARFLVGLPEPLPGRLPVVVILGGIQGGEEDLDRFRDPGPNALVAYGYPYEEAAWGGLDLRERLRVLHDMACRIPVQVAALTRWVAAQPWAERRRITFVGASLGALALPAALHRVQAEGLPATAACFLYGGTGLAAIAWRHFHHRLGLAAGATAAAVVAAFYWPMEPARHLPHLRGPFLVVDGVDDPIFPPTSTRPFEGLLPEPKTVVHLRGGHIAGDRTPLLAQVIRTTRGWLAEMRLVDP